ncbi:helix-turn-helix transcriptional regulator [Actinoplanes missouriensis]|uniref:helix-turn-helix domain-containing protein n=1 Tax=Actinoplanes missouriensis TaxID=1866 RepID=UPI0033D16464
MTSIEGLDALLRSYRERLTPAAAGLPDAGRRRVPGLRRAEVAALAGISPGYYARLERGQAAPPSTEVLAAVARALRLDEQDTARLCRYGRPAPVASACSEPVSAGLRLLIGQVGSLPAYVLGRTQDVLALNALGAALWQDFARHDNLLRMLFLDPAADGFHRDLERARHRAVADLRRAATHAPHDRRVTNLVGELAVRSAAFRSLWARNDLGTPRTGDVEQLRHRGVGHLELRHQAFRDRAAAHQQLIVLHPEPGSASADALVLLGATAAGPPDQACGAALP